MVEDFFHQGASVCAIVHFSRRKCLIPRLEGMARDLHRRQPKLHLQAGVRNLRQTQMLWLRWPIR